MIKLINYRGPDDSGIYLDYKVGLGANRVAILDLRKGLYPLHNEDKSISLLLDGEIYNFKELKARLLNSGHKFYTETSGEVILHLYEDKGISCLEHLNGDFAFAIWDSNEKRLLLARDRFGIKPLYYWIGDGEFLFASEIKVLFLDKTLPREPNEPIIYDFLVTGVHEHTEDTFFKGIKKVMPSEYIIVEESGIKKGKYWKLEAKPEGFNEEKEVIQRFLELFKKSVELRVFDSPSGGNEPRPYISQVGALLSGGLDSSSVVGIVNRVGHDKSFPYKLITFSSCHEDFDERKYIEAVTKKWGLESNYIFPKSSKLWEEFEKFIWHQEEPVRGGSAWDHFSVMRVVHNSGIRILFDGQGGDETLYGYIAYFPQFLWEIKFNVFKLAKEFIAGGDLINLAIRERLLGRHNPKRLLARHFVDKFDKRERQILSELFPKTLSQKSRYAITKYSLPFLLKETERNSSAFGIETRLPFLDHELVEFLFSLPLGYKIRNGWTKWILRQAMRGILPDNVRNRREKIGFGTPESRWARELGTEIEALFMSKGFKSRPYWDANRVQQSFRGFRSGKMLQPDLFWRIISTEIWYRIFFGNNT